jgi:hypothetical protein
MPSLLNAIWDAWSGLAKWLGEVVGDMLMTVFYFTVFGIYALVSKLFSKGSPKKDAKTFWGEKERKMLKSEDDYNIY